MAPSTMNRLGSGAKRSGGRQDMTAEVAVRILDHLAAEGAPPGKHIAAQDLADQLKVSRSPVVQALRLLSSKGVVRHERNRGFFLEDASASSVEHLGFSRESGITRVYFQLAEDRLAGKLADQVSENFLRQEYGLTRGQLAMLLNRISHEGWAERRPGYGWTFSTVLTTPEALEQTYRLRMALEPASVLEPSFRLPRDVAERCRVVEERLLAGEIDTMSADALYERGVQFHEALAAASHNPFFLDTLRRVNRVRRLLAYRSMLDRRRYYAQAKEHLYILDLLVRERNEEAAAALREHLHNVVGNLGQIRGLLEH